MNLAVLISGNSRNLNGAALYVNRFRKFNNLFASYDIFPTVYDHNFVSSHCSSEEEIAAKQVSYVHSKSHKIKQFIRNKLKISFIGSCFYMYCAWIRHAKITVLSNIKAIKNSDAILSNDCWTAYYLLKKVPNVPLYFIMHNNGEPLKMILEELPYLKRSFVEKKLKKYCNEIFEHAVNILFVSKTAEKHFKELYPKFQQKTMYIPEGIEDVSSTVYSSERNYSGLHFICIGTVCDRKNQHSLIEVIAKIIENTNETITLDVVGDGDKLSDCMLLAHSLGLDNVNFHGAVNNNEISEFLAKANVFIMVSKDEGLPGAGIEALRAGLPVVITDVGGCKELIKDNGFLLKGYDVDSIVDGFQTLISERSKFKTWGTNSRKLYEAEFSINAMIHAYSRLLLKRS